MASVKFVRYFIQNLWHINFSISAVTVDLFILELGTDTKRKTERTRTAIKFSLSEKGTVIQKKLTLETLHHSTNII